MQRRYSALEDTSSPSTPATVWHAGKGSTEARIDAPINALYEDESSPNGKRYIEGWARTVRSYSDKERQLDQAARMAASGATGGIITEALAIWSAAFDALPNDSKKRDAAEWAIAYDSYIAPQPLARLAIERLNTLPNDITPNEVNRGRRIAKFAKGMLPGN